MSLIKIMVNDIEIDFVKETLSIKKENNALTRDFKVSHSSVPFLIIENGNTKKALGTRDLSSIKKIKIVDVVVFEGGNKYTGELQILTYLAGFRKCNLKYASSLLSIMNTKISEFMPIVSVIPGETNPVPYVETDFFTKSSGFYTPSEWRNYPVNFISKGFPEVRWQFPTMNWKNKFGEALSEDDEWFAYANHINMFNEDRSEFVENEYVDTTVEFLSVSNKNVPSPQVYLLSPLLFALEAQGFTPSGDFYQSNFIRRLLLLSNKNNLTKTSLAVLLKTYSFSNNWQYGNVFKMFYKSESFAIPTPGTYTLEYSFTFSGPAESTTNVPLYKFLFINPGNVYGDDIFIVRKIATSTFEVKGSVDLDLNSGNSVLYYASKNSIMPVSFSVELKKKYKKEYQKMHPTIQLGRYLPDWTFGTYLNALQTFFNLEINVDDLTKKMSLTFNEEDISSGKKIILKKSLSINSYEAMPYSAFLLKYANDQDDALWITKDGLEKYTTQTCDFLEKLESKFKFVPNTYTSILSEELDSKNGVGLLIYNPEDYPYTSDNFSGQNLKLQGQNGVYEVFWKSTLKFRLNGSVVEMSGPLTEVELNKIINLKRIFVDNQEYIIALLEYSETQQDNFEVKLNLQSVTF
ncbi:MAG: hypothetical protein PHW29_05810 [Flavobacterium sp.]|nr:hypothetical protein [Flavobacterium sp.]